MRAIHFRLDPILTLRTWEEERARTAYAQAMRQEMRFLEAMRAVDARIEEAVTEWRRATAGLSRGSDRIVHWRHLLGLERERRDTAQKLVSARRIREQKMKLLLDAHQRVRILQTLKSRRQQAHLTEGRRREEKELDELVNARFQPDL